MGFSVSAPRANSRGELERLVGQGQPASFESWADHNPFLHDLAIATRIESLAFTCGDEGVDPPLAGWEHFA